MPSWLRMPSQARFRPASAPPSRHRDASVHVPGALLPYGAAPNVGNRVRARLSFMARHYPARMALLIFALIIATITTMLEMPFATTSGHRAPFVDALFTATSAVCVTGLSTVDTTTYWSVFGQAAIALGISIGGLGVMTIASMLGLAVTRHIGLTQRMLAASETKSSGLGQVGSLLKAVAITVFIADFVLFSALLPHYLRFDFSFFEACWYALFMAISIFNNAGFLVLPEGVGPDLSDSSYLIPIACGTFFGAIGFPVIMDLTRNWKTPRRLTFHTKLSITTHITLLAIGALLIGALEWSNPDTLGSLTTGDRIANSLLSGANVRSSGISIVNVGNMSEATWLIQDILMFIGGGSASTAGGIKVTTIAVLTLAVLAEARGDRDVEAFGRRIPSSAVRLAISVTMLGAFLVAVAVLILLIITPYSLDRVLFEAISAFGTCGLSTGITADLPASGKLVLTALMYFGRTGTMTAAAALTLRERRRVIRMAEEQPLIG